MTSKMRASAMASSTARWVVEGRDLEMFVDGVEFVVAQPREQRLAHGQRVDVGVFVKADAGARARVADEQQSKLWALCATRTWSPQNSLNARMASSGGGASATMASLMPVSSTTRARDGHTGVDEGAEFFVPR